MYKNFLEKYKNTSHNVSNLQHVILLYEGAIRFLRNAKIAASENRIEARSNALDKVARIINGLSLCLDHKKGGNIAPILENFYTACYLKLSSLHKSQNLQEYDNLEQSLTTMLNAWKDVANQVNSKPLEKTQETSDFTA